MPMPFILGEDKLSSTCNGSFGSDALPE